MKFRTTATARGGVALLRCTSFCKAAEVYMEDFMVVCSSMDVCIT